MPLKVFQVYTYSFCRLLTLKPLGPDNGYIALEWAVRDVGLDFDYTGKANRVKSLTADSIDSSSARFLTTIMGTGHAIPTQ